MRMRTLDLIRHHSFSMPMFAKNGAAFAAAICIALTVSMESLGQRRIIHPTSDNIPVVDDPSHILAPPGDPSTIQLTYLSTLSVLDTVQIGVNEGDEDEILGNVVDVAHDPDGRIFVLDSEFATVRIYDPDGSHVGSFGRSGTGPGEFQSAASLSLSDSGRFAVVVSGIGPIQVFARREDGLFEYRNSISKHEIASRSGCAMNGHLYLLGYHPERSGPIHKFTLEGEYVDSFGELYKSKNEFVVRVLSGTGLIACSEMHNVVGFIREGVPVLTGYAANNGSMLWRVKFEGFKPTVIEEEDRDTLIHMKSEPGQSLARLLFADSGGFLNIAYIYFTRRGRPTPRHIFRIDAVSGEGTYLGHDKAIVAKHDDYVVHLYNYPYPSLEIISISRQ